MEEIWQRCLARLEGELPAQQFNTWIKPLRLVAQKDRWQLLAPNGSLLQYVRERFLARIQAVLSDLVTMPFALTLALDERSPAVEPALTAAPLITIGNGVRTSDNDPSSRLIPQYTFTNFVGGKANEIARAAAQQVADRPGVAYNPLFIYGSTGLGKTHLIHAIGNHILGRNPAARVRYLLPSEYAGDVVKAYQNKSWDSFKRYYHSLEVLMIDDIQFFAGKDRTQEEFFYAFNALIEARRQVIITADRFPKEIDKMEERLKSRFSWGLTVRIEPPELELRVAILLNKAKAVGVAINEDVAFFIANLMHSNVRDLEGALNRVLAHANFTGHQPSIGLARTALNDLLAVQTRQLSVDNIQKTVADYFKIRVSDMHSAKRVRSLARPRQIAMALAKTLTDKSLPEIGQAFGGRDHTTVLHACKRISELIRDDADVARDHERLLQLLRG